MMLPFYRELDSLNDLNMDFLREGLDVQLNSIIDRSKQAGEMPTGNNLPKCIPTRK